MEVLDKLRAQAGIYQKKSGPGRARKRGVTAEKNAEASRESARNCRARKKVYIALLEQQVVELTGKVEKHRVGEQPAAPETEPADRVEGQVELAAKVEEQAEEIRALRDRIAQQDVTVSLLLGAFD
jgi:hypothetical protein